MSDTSKHNETANEEPVGEVDGRILKPIDRIAGFGVRPGLYRLNGATAFDNAVNFTVHSSGATDCELLFFHAGENEPYAVIPIPHIYKIGDVW